MRHVFTTTIRPIKYIILVIALSVDIVIPAAAAVLLYIAYQISPPFFLIAIVLVILEFRSHQRKGGFENWRPSQIRKYLENATKIGL